jgi:hypothetical protein
MKQHPKIQAAYSHGYQLLLFDQLQEALNTLTAAMPNDESKSYQVEGKVWQAHSLYEAAWNWAADCFLPAMWTSDDDTVITITDSDGEVFAAEITVIDGSIAEIVFNLVAAGGILNLQIAA